MPTSSDVAQAADPAEVGAALQGIAASRPGTEEDWVDGVEVGHVVAVSDAHQAAAILASTRASRASVVVRGAGTKLDWGSPPRSADVVVDVSGLDTIVEHAAGDLIARVQPGVRLADLRTALAPAGQRLAIDETVPGSTIGGVIATGLAGPLRLSHGSARDLVIGVTVALADGRSATSGGRVVKNVAGYDLGKLYTGAFGTLGIITEVFVRLHPLPRRSVWVTVTTPDGPAVDRAALALSAANLAPSAIEVHAGPDAEPVVVALLEGTERGIEGRLGVPARLVDGTAEAEVADTAPRWWGRLPGLGEGETLIKVTTTIASVGDLVTALRALDPNAVVSGSVGVGVLYVGLPACTGADRVGLVMAEARRRCAAAGGSAIVVRAPAAVRAEVDTWGPIPALALMRSVKDRFDPDHRLAPGRFVGGI